MPLKYAESRTFFAILVTLVLSMPATSGCQRKASVPCERPKEGDKRCKIVRAKKGAEARHAASAPAGHAQPIPGLPLDRVTDAQRALFYSVVEDQFDPCGKPRSFGETLRKHADKCPVAVELARYVLELVKAGGERSDIVVALLEETRRLNHEVTLRLQGRPRIGPEDAVVTVAEFYDYECPYCRELRPRVDEMLKRYPKVALLAKQCPIEGHLGSDKAAWAAVAAARQGRFAQMHAALFARGSELSTAAIDAAAREAGLDLDRMHKDEKDPALLRLVEEDLEDADRAEIEGTPSFWIDGVEVPFNRLEETLRAKLAAKEE